MSTIYDSMYEFWIGGGSLNPTERAELLEDQRQIMLRQQSSGVLNVEAAREQLNIITAVENAPTPAAILGDELRSTAIDDIDWIKRQYEGWTFDLYGGDFGTFANTFMEGVGQRIDVFNPVGPSPLKPVNDLLSSVKWIIVAGAIIYGLTLISPAVKNAVKGLTK